MDLQQQLDEIRGHWHGMFASRDSLPEALQYAYSMNDAAVTTAVHVLLNTVIKLLEQTDSVEQV